MIGFQALFVAPCSHCFHFKCVKPILFTSTGFSCPLCRTYADLEASVTIDENEMDVDAKLPPVLLPPTVQSAVAAVASVAAAEDAVAAAETHGAAREEVGQAIRDDANATPVPNEQAAMDSFGTTPVGSMPTSLAAQFGGVDANAPHDADVSLVGGGSALMAVSSPASSSDVAMPAVADSAGEEGECTQQQQQQQQQQQPGASAAAGEASS
ncbi:hypothetical protein IWW57_005715 [Coemansia sp. S610]|nr:hypothetical protein IWW57_005715 [Coemansia sp. S610]KAJ2412449.1 hypothetical protein GGI10_003678 [Coemansia sp. RSA 2530]